MDKNRRGRPQFITQLGMGTVALGASNMTSFAFSPKLNSKNQSIRIGWITDLHHGLALDAQLRLQDFIDEASKRNLDFILQGGDFCHPIPDGKECIDLWNSYPGEKFHVLGNHDMDKGTKQQAMDFWSMNEKYYSFDKGDFHFVVMDGNYILKDDKYVDYANANFYIDQQRRSLVNPEQVEWLKIDLAKTDKQTVIISHQAFDEIWDGWSSPSRYAVRKVIDDANNNPHFQKVIACFCGHHHIDDHSYINNVHYFQMNSASYYWAGEGYGSIKSMAMYRDPLYAFVSLDPSGIISIEGKMSQFQHPTPTEKNHPDASRLSASITDKYIEFKNK